MDPWQQQQGQQNQGQNPNPNPGVYPYPNSNQPNNQFQPQPQQPGAVANVPVQQPEVYNSPAQMTAQYGIQPFPQPAQVPANPSSNPQFTTAKQGPNKLLIAAIVGVVLVLLLVITAAVLSSGGNKKAEQTQKPQTAINASLVPAQSVEIEQINNAISQDLSQIDDERDFPSASLEDTTLGL